MDDKTRRVGGQRDDMTGRADETTRNLGTTTPGTTATSAAASTRAGSTRRNTSGSSTRRTTAASTPSTNAASTDEGLDRETDQRTRELQAEIADTREELSETIEAIQERLRPGSIVSNATETVKDKARESVRGLTDTVGERARGMMKHSRRGTGVVDTVRDNPVPALMIGAGVAWLLMDRSRHESGRRWDTRDRGWSPYGTTGRRSYGEYGTGYEANSVEAGTGLDFDDDAEYSDIDYRRNYRTEGRGYDTGGRGLTHNVSERASHLMGDARDRWQRTSRNTTSGLQRLMRENPLLVGAAAVLVGAAVGAALPETERENELMGETRDTMVNQAQEMAQNAASTVKEVASHIPSQVTDAVASKVTGSSTPSGSDRSGGTNRTPRTEQTPVATGSNPESWRRE